MVQHILFLTENEYFYLCIIYSLLTMMYTFKQEIQLAAKNFYVHRTVSGSTSPYWEYKCTQAVQFSVLLSAGYCR